MLSAWGKEEAMQHNEEGCPNGAVKGGVYQRHGAMAKRCSREGECTNKARTRGVCVKVKHGA